MNWLNYHHFLYFWVVAKEGTIVKASKKLLLAHPTISGQIHNLEKSLGVKLFARQGRRLVLTEAGQIAYHYADEIFSLGREFVETVQGRPSGRPLKLSVGVAEVLPPSLVRSFLEPAFRLNHGIQIECRADKSVREFVAELALHQLDVVIADGPAGWGVPVRAYSHLLGECGTTFMAAPELARKLRPKFPASLDKAPFVMPGIPCVIRSTLDDWFEVTGVQPTITAVCDDSALIKEFGASGMGVFAVPEVIEQEVRQQYKVAVVGRASNVMQQFFAISGERKIKHPAVVAICNAARLLVFNKDGAPAALA